MYFGYCPLSDVSFACIFFYSVVCLLILLTLCFTEKFLSLMKSSLTIISFMNYAFGIISKKCLTYSRSSRFSLMLSSRSFIAFLLFSCQVVSDSLPPHVLQHARPPCPAPPPAACPSSCPLCQ